MKNWMRWLAGGTLGATLAILGLIACVANAKVDPPGAVALAFLVGLCGGATLMYVAMDDQYKRADEARMASLQEATVREQLIAALQAENARLHSIRTTHKGAGKK